MKKVVAVFGYNNSRIYDVEKIARLARGLLSADLLLIKEGVNDADRKVASFCFDHPPEDPGIAPALAGYLDRQKLELVACLPFSDKGVIGAANAAKHFGLFGDDVETARAMLDKDRFRDLEAGSDLDPRNYLKPAFERADTEVRIRTRFAERGSFFLKPTSEGNSRGCMKIESEADLDRWFSENGGAVGRGVLCEDILALSDEYSFDGVAGTYWITKKFTTSGQYRAEYQHVVPAPLEANVRERIHGVLEPFLRDLGTRGGAFHHEFFLLKDGRVASVEPNRRPAGMWIWDLASSAFEDFDPWRRWILKCNGAELPEERLVPKSYCGVRAVISRSEGKVAALDASGIENKLRNLFGDRARISFLKGVGDRVRAEPRDNSDFLAFVSLSDPDYPTLLESLEKAEAIFLDGTEVLPCA